MTRHLYKLFQESDRHWAKEFVDGRIRFRSLGYYRDFEEAETRGDRHEGQSVHRPPRGLSITRNGQPLFIPNAQFRSDAKVGDIFVLCLALSSTRRHREEFGSVVAKIRNADKFCERIEAALPAHSELHGVPGNEYLGHPVIYYRPSDLVGTRYALPGEIAVSKFAAYQWQREFRLVFSTTGALAFQNCQMFIDIGDPPAWAPDPSTHQFVDIAAGSLHDICSIEPAAGR